MRLSLPSLRLKHFFASKYRSLQGLWMPRYPGMSEKCVLVADPSTRQLSAVPHYIALIVQPCYVNGVASPVDKGKVCWLVPSQRLQREFCFCFRVGHPKDVGVNLWRSKCIERQPQTSHSLTACCWVLCWACLPQIMYR